MSDSYVENLAGAKPRPPIKPVIIPEFVDLDALANAGRLELQRHGRTGWEKSKRWRLVTPGLDLERVHRRERRANERASEWEEETRSERARAAVAGGREEVTENAKLSKGSKRSNLAMEETAGVVDGRCVDGQRSGKSGRWAVVVDDDERCLEGFDCDGDQSQTARLSGSGRAINWPRRKNNKIK